MDIALVGVTPQVASYLVIGFASLAFISLIVNVLTFILMGAEGRYHLKRGFSKKGVDLLLYNKMSNSFEQKTIKFNGKFWEFGKEAIFFGLEALKNPENDTEESYNEAISKTPHWKYNRRPVLIATTELFYAFTPDFISFLSKGLRSSTPSDFEDWPDIETGKSYRKITNNPSHIKKDNDKGIEIYKRLLDLAKRGYGKAFVIATANIQSVLEHIDGTTAWYIREAFDMGEDSGIQLMTRPKRPIISMTKLVIGAAAIFGIIALLIILQKGGIPNPFAQQ